MTKLPECFFNYMYSSYLQCSNCAIKQQCKDQAICVKEAQDIIDKTAHIKNTFCLGSNLLDTKEECKNCRKHDSCSKIASQKNISEKRFSRPPRGLRR